MLHGIHDLLLDERPRLVLVHELEGFPSGIEELGRELLQLFSSRLGARVAVRVPRGPCGF